ncbi:PREDICTED: uncharacterized protein LOC109219418 [Nicotiana attenuata]|uniref:uncharacterized protein LOC109219418 n=1 Tax=Nicotiana attenuata TaxID=49451 RepID=UPI000904BB14|nr:PREDICTED: uncharacterized protein LOC109219418 [Nicotiana attenuata]
MAKDIEQLMIAQVKNQPQVGCDICGLGHPSHECQTFTAKEEVKQQNPRAPVQGPPSFQTQQRQSYQTPQPNNSSLEDLMKAFINKSDKKLETQGTTIREQGTAIHNLERQMGQLAALLLEKAPWTLPADTEKNPKETIKAVFLRSGKTLAEPKKIGESLPKEDVSSKEVDKQKVSSEVEASKNMPLLPFRQKMKREKLDKCFGKFLEMVKQLYVDIPFTEVLTLMPPYAKFLEEILSSTRKLEEMKLVKLNAHCSAILQNKFPNKCGDPGSFTIPCSLGSKNFDKALCDSGASINLMA